MDAGSDPAGGGLMDEDYEELKARFPRYGDKDCPHPPERQVRDGQGTLCLDCAVLRVIAW